MTGTARARKRTVWRLALHDVQQRFERLADEVNARPLALTVQDGNRDRVLVLFAREFVDIVLVVVVRHKLRGCAVPGVQHAVSVDRARSFGRIGRLAGRRQGVLVGIRQQTTERTVVDHVVPNCVRVDDRRRRSCAVRGEIRRLIWQHEQIEREVVIDCIRNVF